jgi:hypothetical protein
VEAVAQAHEVAVSSRLLCLIARITFAREPRVFGGLHLPGEFFKVVNTDWVEEFFGGEAHEQFKAVPFQQVHPAVDLCEQHPRQTVLVVLSSLSSLSGSEERHELPVIVGNGVARLI